MTRRLAPPACQPGPRGLHYHQLVDLTTGELMEYGFLHDWSRGTGHPTSPDPMRPHRHRWTESAIRGELASLVGAKRAADLARQLDGAPQCGPSTAERPGSLSELDDERSLLTLHPELRPAHLRDS